jgi:hypothetical protein
MKIKLTLLAALFTIAAASTASAEPLTPNEIFTAIDGTYDHTIDDKIDTSRVNFSMSSSDDANANAKEHKVLSNVLSGIDGEYNQ